MKPFDVDYEKLKNSISISDGVELLKLKLVASFINITSGMSSHDICRITGLHKADLSRLRSLSISRFSIDKILSLLDKLGFFTELKVYPKES